MERYLKFWQSFTNVSTNKKRLKIYLLCPSIIYERAGETVKLLLATNTFIKNIWNFCPCGRRCCFSQNTHTHPLHPWYMLLYNFLVTHPNFMKFRYFFWNLFWINILIFFFKIGTIFCSVGTFLRPGVIFCVCPLLE